MSTPASVKTAIDSQITNKTAPFSISNIDVGSRLKDIIDLIQNGAVIVFNSTADRIAYLGTTAAAPFQFGADAQDGNIYYINLLGTGWTQFAATQASIQILPFSNQSSLTITWDGAMKAKFGNAGTFVLELLGDDGIYRQTPGVQVVPNDINNTTFYTIDLGGSQSGRLIIK